MRVRPIGRRMRLPYNFPIQHSLPHLPSPIRSPIFYLPCYFDLWEKFIPDGERSLVAALAREDNYPNPHGITIERISDVSIGFFSVRHEQHSDRHLLRVDLI